MNFPLLWLGCDPVSRTHFALNSRIKSLRLQERCKRYLQRKRKLKGTNILNFSLGELTGKSLSTNQLSLSEDVTTSAWTICGMRGGDLFKNIDSGQKDLISNIDNTWPSATKWLVNLNWKTDCKLNPWSTMDFESSVKSLMHSCLCWNQSNSDSLYNLLWRTHFPMAKGLSFLVKLVYKIDENSLPLTILGQATVNVSSQYGVRTETNNLTKRTYQEITSHTLLPLNHDLELWQLNSQICSRRI